MVHFLGRGDNWGKNFAAHDYRVLGIAQRSSNVLEDLFAGKGLSSLDNLSP